MGFDLFNKNETNLEKSFKITKPRNKAIMINETEAVILLSVLTVCNC